MADDETPQPEPEPEVEPVELQEPEIQQEIADDQTWMQKGLTDDDYETRASSRVSAASVLRSGWM